MQTNAKMDTTPLREAITKYRALPPEQFQQSPAVVEALATRAMMNNTLRPLQLSADEVHVGFISGISAAFEAGVITAEQAAEVTLRGSLTIQQIGAFVDEQNAKFDAEDKQGHVGGDTFPGEFAQSQGQTANG